VGAKAVALLDRTLQTIVSPRERFTVEVVVLVAVLGILAFVAFARLDTLARGRARKRSATDGGSFPKPLRERVRRLGTLPRAAVQLTWRWVTARRVLGGALLLIALSALFPPWEHEGRIAQWYKFAPLWSSGPEECVSGYTCHVALGRLLLEWIIVAGIGGSFIALGAAKGRER
jgi:hypothetical protein